MTWLKQFLLVLIVFLFVVVSATSVQGKDFSMVDLKLNEDYSETLKSNDPNTAVYHISPFHTLFCAFSCIQMNVTLSDGQFDVKFVNDLDNITLSSSWMDTFKAVTRVFVYNPDTTARSYSTCLSPYDDHYFVVNPLDVSHNKKLQVKIQLKAFDPYCYICLLAGLILFYNAIKLSQSMYFYYTSATGIGILASMLILVYILSKFLPKKPAAYSVLLGGWSVCAWIISKIWQNLLEIMLNYYQYVLGYVMVSGLVSFAICYRYTTVIDERSCNLLQWTLQLISLFLIYNGSQMREVSLAIILLIITHQQIFIPGGSIRDKLKEISFLNCIVKYYKKPKPQKMLTNEEYHLQGQVETKNALEELRKFCHSPQCSPWKTLSMMESPKRFAKFIEGDSHLLDTEISQYEEDMQLLYDSDSGDESLRGDITFAEESFFTEDEDIEPVKLQLNGCGEICDERRE